MKNKFLLLTAAIFISNINISHAADVVYNSPEAPAYDEASIWGGAYIGGQVGYNWAKSKVSSDNINDSLFDNYNSSINASPAGFIGGIYAGYNWEFSNAYLFGIEGDINYADLSKTTVLTGPNNEYTFTPRVEFEGAVRARFGVNYERWLPYVAGGLSVARAKDTFTEQDAIILAGFEQTDTRIGFTIGAGVDYALTNNLLLRAEYRYADYGKRTFGGDDDNARVKLTTNNVRLGIAYKF